MLNIENMPFLGFYSVPNIYVPDSKSVQMSRDLISDQHQ